VTKMALQSGSRSCLAWANRPNTAAQYAAIYCLRQHQWPQCSMQVCHHF